MESIDNPALHFSTVPKVRRVLEAGKVHVCRVSARAVVEIEEFEDEGTGYIFDIGDGKLLFLRGQQYHPDDETQAWPNTDFDLVRSVDGGLLIGIFCRGDRLKPLDIIPPAECAPEITAFEQEQVVEGDLMHFAASLCKLHCRQCGYDLRGTLPAGLTRCPECGTAVEPDQLGRWQSQRGTASD